MSSIRLQVVDAIAASLAAATGIKLYRNLDHAVSERRLPALVVRSGEDRTLGQTIGQIDQQAEIGISILVACNESPETEADPHECGIHAALMASPIFGGVSVLMERIGGNWSFDLGDIAERTLIYRFGYRTAVTNLEI